jgi:hypothetical protein
VNNSHHIDVINNIVHHMPSAGIRIGGSDYANVIGNTIYECNKRNSVGTPALVLSNINSIDNNDATKIIVARNRVYDNRNELYSWAPAKTKIVPLIDEGKGISIEHCITRSVGPSWDHGRVRIENNICYRNGFSGINTNEAQRVDVLFNTCFNNTASGRGVNVGISINDTYNARVYNNIIQATNNFGGAALAVRPLTYVTNDDIIFKNNIIVGTIEKRADSVDINTMIINPNWVDTLEFRLNSGSPAVNSAVDTLTPTLDFYGQLRDVNDPDIGAVEFIPTCNKIVSHGKDNGSGSLREVLSCVQDGDTIRFGSGVLELNILSTILVDKNVTFIHPTNSTVPLLKFNMSSSSILSGLIVDSDKTMKLYNVHLQAMNNVQNKPVIENRGKLMILGNTQISSISGAN